MKHSMILKFLAIVLAALSLVATVAGTMGIVAMENAGLYVRGLDELQDQQCEVIAATVAKSFAQCHAVGRVGEDMQLVGHACLGVGTGEHERIFYDFRIPNHAVKRRRNTAV